MSELPPAGSDGNPRRMWLGIAGIALLLIIAGAKQLGYDIPLDRR